ncbi:hypothetical protein GGTG_01868 [Gaeumannomyces tritici R3-111a-1]|uniref:Cyclin-dependent kinase n=1 Tax=Gaeumannomyces tritici (strain R3-111a-1) TaxID=644352 RepID=J3NKS7_GAET3|nr:hypothetical protein GGTG_01868 [Gaeumannomyces tritici R3-111a-1]EJT81894.1 hypothetical protein GGTG_01868 [Gaeumannomyces tritici R3-111a-1]
MNVPAASSPKRRVLGPLDVNRSSPAPPMATGAKFAGAAASASPLKLSATSRPTLPTEQEQPRKRPFASMAGTAAASHQQQPVKKACMDPEVKDETPTSSDESTQQEQPESIERDADTRQRSPSPAESSVFDMSGVDTTQATALTEPDVEDPAATLPYPAPATSAPAPARRPQSRTEATRQKAEMIRLRLSLAAYKVRTGQTDVPLERLQMIRPASAGLSGSRPSSAAETAAVRAPHRCSIASTLSSDSRHDGVSPRPAIARVHPPPFVFSVPSETAPATRRASGDNQEVRRDPPAQESRQEQQQDEKMPAHPGPRLGTFPAPQPPRIPSLAAPPPIMIPSGPGSEAAAGLIRSPLRGPAADGLLELMKSSQ